MLTLDSFDVYRKSEKQKLLTYNDEKGLPQPRETEVPVQKEVPSAAQRG